MKDKQGLNRWSLLEEAGTVLDERFHHDAIYSHLVETAAFGRQLEAEIARLRDEVERLRAAATNHDAAPAAKAEVAPGTGHTQSDTGKPVERLRLTDAGEYR